MWVIGEPCNSICSPFLNQSVPNAIAHAPYRELFFGGHTYVTKTGQFDAIFEID